MANSVAEIAVRVRPLAPGDSLARAAEAVRTSPGGAAPIQEEGQITGLVCADAMADWAVSHPNEPPQATAKRLMSLMWIGMERTAKGDRFAAPDPDTRKLAV